MKEELGELAVSLAMATVCVVITCVSSSLTLGFFYLLPPLLCPGDDWTKPDLFRIGASSLLTDIERQLFHCATGIYAADHKMALS